MPRPRAAGAPRAGRIGELTADRFRALVRDALQHLYDGPLLEVHPLAGLARPDRVTTTAGQALRRGLVDGVDALRVVAPPGTDARGRRGHRILVDRYVECRPIPEILRALAIGRSEYFREHALALDALAALLRDRWGLAERVVPFPRPRVVAPARPARAGSVPTPLTSFVGRERELVDVAALLGNHRLVTLTGAGGVGKTRLALRLAAQLLERCPEEAPDGAWFVDLAPLADPALVPQAAVDALGLRGAPGRSAEESLIGHLTTRGALVVLDNCEHVVATAARLAERLLRGCPRLRLLATSREVLGVPGECVWRVPSLSLPDAAGPRAAESVGRSEAVRLFVERARLASPGFDLTDRSAPAVAAVCRSLDGIPLALELAAARVRAMGAEQIAARLDERFRLFVDGPRTALPRHQTLAAAIAWSHDMLPEPERRLFDRLSVFSGGFSLDAAERVCTGGGIAVADVAAVLARLVDKSLVLPEDLGGAAESYRLLETLRQYGRERLVASGEADLFRARHADFYLGLAERTEAALEGPDRWPWLARLERAVENVRSALRWSVEHGDAERALRGCGALALFYGNCAFPGEWRAFIEGLLSAAAVGPGAPARGHALAAMTDLATRHGEYALARRHGEKALTILRSSGDRSGEVQASWALCHALVSLGEYVRAREAGEAGLAVAPATGSAFWADRLRHIVGQACYHQGDHAAAEAHLGVAIATNPTAGDHDWLGHVARARGDNTGARGHYLAALALRQRDGAPLNHGFTLCGFAALASAEGEHVRAARLAGAAAALCESAGVPPTRMQQAGTGDLLAASRRALGAAAFDAAWAAGRAMTLEEAASYAADSRATDTDLRRSAQADG